MAQSKILDASTLQSAKKGSDPWKRISVFLDVHGTNKERHVRAGGYTSESCSVRMKYKGHILAFNVRCERLPTGPLESVNFKTTVVKPGLVNPSEVFDYAISMEMARTFLDVESSTLKSGAKASISYISKKPSHGVTSGSDALDLAIRLARHFGCTSAELYDASQVACTQKSKNQKSNKPEKNSHNSNSTQGVDTMVVDAFHHSPPTTTSVSLRTARLLTKGNGWYESKGFHSMAEASDPVRHRQLVGKLHRLKVADLVKNFTQIVDAAQEAMFSTSRRKAKVAYNFKNVYNGGEVRAATTGDLAALLLSFGTARDLLEDFASSHDAAPRRRATLSDAVAFWLERDCGTASAFFTALLPHAYGFMAESTPYRVLLTRSGTGDPVPQPLELDSWLYAWRLLSSDASMHMAL